MCVRNQLLHVEQHLLLFFLPFFLETDLIPACATFLSCLFLRLEIGIVIGIGINVIFLLYASARPSVHVEKVTVSDSIFLSLQTRLTVFFSDYFRLWLFVDNTRQESGISLCWVREVGCVEGWGEAGLELNTCSYWCQTYTGCWFYSSEGERRNNIIDSHF